jgi:cystathionine beta-lyase/cystathionine gamma-synthase
MKASNWNLDTRVVHAGHPKPRIERAAVMPIYQCAVYEYDAEEAEYLDVRYPRLNNLPSHRALGRKLASLEGADAAMVTSSGMAAISSALLHVLGEGGHVLIQDQLYGGTHTFAVHDLKRFGMSFDFISVDDPDDWKSKLKPATRAIYTESMTNPLLRVIDHHAVVEFAREHSLVSMIDNTFATPVNFRPAEFGYDVSLHSATKYLNGHSDLVAGAAIGVKAQIDGIEALQAHLGGTLAPHACFLLERGIRTLALRVRQQNANTLALTRHLDAHPSVARVNYPGLETHPDHARARELFSGFSGMFSLELTGGLEAANRLIAGLEIPIHGPSLGGLETLVTRPSTTSHSGLSASEREELGITDGLIRVSVGIESIDDLIADFDSALS